MSTLLTPADVARALRTTPAAVRSLARSAGLPHVELPRLGMRFDPADVERWLRSRSSPPAGGSPVCGGC